MFGQVVQDESLLLNQLLPRILFNRLQTLAAENLESTNLGISQKRFNLPTGLRLKNWLQHRLQNSEGTPKNSNLPAVTACRQFGHMFRAKPR